MIKIQRTARTGTATGKPSIGANVLNKRKARIRVKKLLQKPGSAPKLK